MPVNGRVAFFPRKRWHAERGIGRIGTGGTERLRGFEDERGAHRRPYKTLASDKATLVVAECIQFGWQDESVFGVDAGGFKEPSEAGGFTVYTTGGDYFVDIQSVGAGSSVKYYAAEDTMPAKRRLAALATCL